MRAAVYVRVSTLDQEPENQLGELRRYAEARGWRPTEFVGRGVSGSKDRRPALDAFMAGAKRRQFDVLCCWRLGRLGRNLRHLVMTLEELEALESRSSHSEKASTAPHQRAAFSSTFWRRWRSSSASGFERVMAGLRRAKEQGKRLGRPRLHPPSIDAPGGTVRAYGLQLGVCKVYGGETDSFGLRVTMVELCWDKPCFQRLPFRLEMRLFSQPAH